MIHGSGILDAAHQARYAAMMRPPRIRLIHHRGNIGLAVHGRMLGAALKEAGVACEELEFPAKPDPGSADVNILFCWPAPSWIAPGEYNVALTMTETTWLAPPTVQKLNTVDAVMVPATFCRDAFIRSGVTVPVFVIPTGVTAPPDPGEPKYARYRFLSIFEFNSHKDPRTLLDAYFQEFGSYEHVSLVLKCSSPKLIELLKQYTGGPPVEVIRSHSLSVEDMWKLHYSADCYVSPHHSEGWGLPLMDAMAAGKPVIATGFGGNTDFMTGDTSFLLDYSMIPAYSMNEITAQDKSQWAQASLPELRARMRYVFENREHASYIGERAREHIQARFTPALTAGAICAAVAQLRSGGPPKPQKIPGPMLGECFPLPGHIMKQW